jgi:hypothetical protein
MAGEARLHALNHERSLRELYKRNCPLRRTASKYRRVRPSAIYESEYPMQTLSAGFAGVMTISIPCDETRTTERFGAIAFMGATV